MKLHGDNINANRFVTYEKIPNRVRHLENRWFYNRELVKRGYIREFNTPTELEIADMMTKALPGTTLEKLKRLAAIFPIEEASRKKMGEAWNLHQQIVKEGAPLDPVSSQFNRNHRIHSSAGGESSSSLLPRDAPSL